MDASVLSVSSKEEPLAAPDALDSTLQHFFAEIHKKDGKDYEPCFLAAMQNSADRYLGEPNYEYSILNILYSKARILREKIPNKTNSLTRQEEDILWECIQLGDKTPKSIIATLWWQLTQHYGLRGRQEHHSIRVED